MIQKPRVWPSFSHFCVARCALIHSSLAEGLGQPATDRAMPQARSCSHCLPQNSKGSEGFHVALAAKFLSLGSPRCLCVGFLLFWSCIPSFCPFLQNLVFSKLTSARDIFNIPVPTIPNLCALISLEILRIIALTTLCTSRWVWGFASCESCGPCGLPSALHETGNTQCAIAFYWCPSPGWMRQIHSKYSYLCT